MADTPDDDHEHEDDNGFLSMPPSVAAIFGLRQPPSQEQLDRHHMAIEEKHTRIKRFYTEQTVENLATFGQLMSDLAHTSEANDYAAYLQGRAEAILEHVHNVCGHCGVDHDSLEEIVTPEPEVEE